MNNFLISLIRHDKGIIIWAHCDDRNKRALKQRWHIYHIYSRGDIFIFWVGHNKCRRTLFGKRSGPCWSLRTAPGWIIFHFWLQELNCVDMIKLCCNLVDSRGGSLSPCLTGKWLIWQICLPTWQNVGRKCEMGIFYTSGCFGSDLFHCCSQCLYLSNAFIYMYS